MSMISRVLELAIAAPSLLGRAFAQVTIEAPPLLPGGHRLEQGLGRIGVGPLGHPSANLRLELLRGEPTRELAMLAQPLANELEMPLRILDRVEVGEAEAAGLPVEDAVDRVLPELQVDVRWRS